jgi:three-Cys-motif partner protein
MSHAFGGNWTEEKLEVMRRYFAAYSQALKHQRFTKWYVDAFAGTGDRSDGKAEGPVGSSLFGEDATDVVSVKDGSVRIALGIDPPFDRYVLIEQSKEHVAALQALRTEFPKRSIDIVTGEANDILRELAQKTVWRQTRAAVFIDPYGMQVDWETLEILAATKAVDIALLFPTGPLNRLLTRDGNIPIDWARRIDSHLGPCDWRSACYAQEPVTDLFSTQAAHVTKKMTANGLRHFVLQRLQSVFPYVCEEPLELKNSKGAILYHLFIICVNPSDAAVKLARRLASSALKLPRKSKR